MLVGSTGANPYVAAAAGVAALWGPAHGGANEAVLKNAGRNRSSENVQSAVDKAKDKESGFRLMGFGNIGIDIFSRRFLLMSLFDDVQAFQS